MEFIRGEVRTVDFEIISCENIDFKIQTAKVELIYNQSTLKDIPATISNHSVSFTFDTTDLTDRYYKLLVTIDLGVEIIKRYKEVIITNV